MTIKELVRAWKRIAAVLCVIVIGVVVVRRPWGRGVEKCFSLGSVDLGTLMRGQRSSGELRVTNDSNAAWNIASADVKCGCVTLDSVTTSVAPDASLVVGFTFDSHGIVGETRRIVTVRLREDGRLLEGEVRAKCSSGAYMDPPALEVGLDSDATAFTAGTRLYVDSTDEVKVVRAVAVPTGIAVSIAALERDKRRNNAPYYALLCNGSLSKSSRIESYQLWIEVVFAGGSTVLALVVTAARGDVDDITPRLVILSERLCPTATVSFQSPEGCIASISAEVSPVGVCASRVVSANAIELILLPKSHSGLAMLEIRICEEQLQVPIVVLADS